LTPTSSLFPYTTLFRSGDAHTVANRHKHHWHEEGPGSEEAPQPRRGGHGNSSQRQKRADQDHPIDPHPFGEAPRGQVAQKVAQRDRKSTRLNSSHVKIS